MPPVRALVFDFDGLLVDTESAALRAWEETLAGRGLTLPLDLWHALVGAAPLRPGVAGYLAEATRLGLGLAVASSATGDWVAAHLRRLGTHEAFTVVVTGDTHAAKPAPDTYLAALSALAVPAEEAVAFEDSPAGVRAAKAAGLRCVAVPNPVTSALAFPDADLLVASLDAIGLPDLLARLGFAVPGRPG